MEAEPTYDDWYANTLWLDGRKCPLLTHAGTLCSVFAASVRKQDLQLLGPNLVRLIETALRQENLPLDILGPLDPTSLRLARTVSRACSAS